MKNILLVLMISLIGLTLCNHINNNSNDSTLRNSHYTSCNWSYYSPELKRMLTSHTYLSNMLVAFRPLNVSLHK